MRKTLRNHLVVQFTDQAGAEHLLAALRQSEQQHGLRLDKYAIIARDGEGQGKLLSERRFSLRHGVLLGLGVGLAIALVNAIGVYLWPYLQDDLFQQIAAMLPNEVRPALYPIVVGALVVAGNEGFARARSFAGFLLFGPAPGARQPAWWKGLVAAALAGAILAAISLEGSLSAMLLFLRVEAWFPTLYSSPGWVYQPIRFVVDVLPLAVIYGLLGFGLGGGISVGLNRQFTRAELLQEAARLAAGTTALVAVARFGDLTKAQSALAGIRAGTLIEQTLPEGIALRLGVPVPAAATTPSA